MSKYKVEDKVKEFFDQREIKPSLNVWERINIGLDIKAEDDIKVFFNERELKPSKSAWEEIESTLPAVKSGRGLLLLSSFRFRAAAAVIAVFLSSLIAIYLHQDVSNIDGGLVEKGNVKIESFEVEPKQKSLVNTVEEDQMRESVNIKVERIDESEINQKNEQSPSNRKIITASKNEEKRKNLIAPKEVSKIDVKRIEIENSTSAIVAVAVIKELNAIQNDQLNQESNNIIEENASTASTQVSKSYASNNGARKYGLDPARLLLDAENKSNDQFLTKVFKGIQETSSAIFTLVSQRNMVVESN